jgi:hypothetical protein
MNAVAPARREPAPIEVLKGIVARRAEDFKMVLPSHITVDKFQRTIATAALANPQLMSCDRQSLLIAAMKLAQDGLLPDGREAALVPFKTWNKDTRENVWMVQAMPMAWGVRKKILQSGQVVSLETGLVYRAEMEGGNFIYEIGMDPPIRHRPKLDMTDEETGMTRSSPPIPSPASRATRAPLLVRRGHAPQRDQQGSAGQPDRRRRSRGRGWPQQGQAHRTEGAMGRLVR